MTDLTPIPVAHLPQEHPVRSLVDHIDGFVGSASSEDSGLNRAELDEIQLQVPGLVSAIRGAVALADVFRTQGLEPRELEGTAFALGLAAEPLTNGTHPPQCEDNRIAILQRLREVENSSQDAQGNFEIAVDASQRTNTDLCHTADAFIAVQIAEGGADKTSEVRGVFENLVEYAEYHGETISDVGFWYAEALELEGGSSKTSHVLDTLDALSAAADEYQAFLAPLLHGFNAVLPLEGINNTNVAVENMRIVAEVADYADVHVAEVVRDFVALLELHGGNNTDRARRELRSLYGV
ncbi:MAG: hypothetical protein AAFQ82_23805 [Myxococcota bacterium]